MSQVRVKSSGNRAPVDRLTGRVVVASEAIGDFIELWGFKSIHGRVWALLAMSGRPIPQVEIAEMLGVSRSLINAAVAELVDYGLIEATAEHRNAPYEARLDVWPTITNVLRQREWMLMEKARLALESALKEAEISKDMGSNGGFELRRIRLLLIMTEFAQTCLRGVLAVRMPRALDPFSDWLSGATKFVNKLPKQVRLF